MLKGDKLNTPYFNLSNQTPISGSISTIPASNGLKTTSQNGSSENAVLALNNGQTANGTPTTGGKQQKVTRRVAHEICEKRKLEVQEFELAKRVKTEGDANETLIKQLVKQVESDFATNENDVSKIRVILKKKIFN